MAPVEDEDVQASATYISGLETNAIVDQPRGGLYSRWEGIQPQNGLSKTSPSTTLVEPEDKQKIVSDILGPTASPDKSTSTPAKAHVDAVDTARSNASQGQANTTGQTGTDRDVLRADPTHFGQAYSERNPPPNIQSLRQNEQTRHEASRRYFEENSKGKPATTAADTTGKSILRLM